MELVKYVVVILPSVIRNHLRLLMANFSTLPDLTVPRLLDYIGSFKRFFYQYYLRIFIWLSLQKRRGVAYKAHQPFADKP